MLSGRSTGIGPHLASRHATTNKTLDDQGVTMLATQYPILDIFLTRDQSRDRPHLVGTHQPAVSSHIGRKNGCKVTFNARPFQGALLGRIGNQF